jgi:hypothetical protein
MAPQRPEDGFVRMPEHEFEAILARAAEEGAKRALADVGLEGDEAALDIRDLRSMLDCSGWCAAPPCRPSSARSPPRSCSRCSPASPSS